MTYHSAQQLLAWTERTDSASVYLANLASPDRRVELKSDVTGLASLSLSEDGTYLAGLKDRRALRAWNVHTGKLAATVDGEVRDSVFAAQGQVLLAALQVIDNHEIAFYNLAQTDRPPRRVRGRYVSEAPAASPDGRLVAASTLGGEVRLFDPVNGVLLDSIRGHLNAVFTLAFSPDGRRLISTCHGHEAVKLWDVDTRQELLTFSSDSSGKGRWSSDGESILLGTSRFWQAPSWEEIAAAEAKEKPEIRLP
jgi:WD40 repeat protein